MTGGGAAGRAGRAVLLALLATAASGPLARSLAAPAAGPAAAPPAAKPAAEAGPAGFTKDDEQVLQVSSNHAILSDAMIAYAHGTTVYLPLGELARTLDLAISVEAGGRRASGWFIRDTRRFALDLDAGTVTVEGKTQPLPPDGAVAVNGEILVRSDLLEAWFPLKLKLDVSSATLDVAATEPLPFQERLEREARRLKLGAGGFREAQTLPFERTPYVLFTPPAVDLNIRAATGRSNPSAYDARLSGDFAFMSADAYITGDRRQAVSSVRADLSRKDPNGIGLLDLRELDVGDVFSPDLPNGVRSSQGRGIVVSNIAPGETSLSNRTDVRGPMPEGFEAELYQNNVLIASQATAVNGQYEFRDVSLTYGVNTLRIVLYGPRGERREEERVVRVGAGAIAPGTFRFSAGLLQVDKPLFDVGVQDPQAYSQPVERGRGQFVALAEYGLRPGLAVAGNIGVRPEGVKDVTLAGVGLRADWRGAGFRLDATAADDGSQALSGSILTTIRGINLGFEHAEYFGGFRDDTRSLDNVPLNSFTAFRSDFVLKGFGREAPISLQIQDKERTDGSSDITGGARTSFLVRSNVLVSGGLIYQETSGVGSREELLTELGVNSPFFGGQLRVAGDYAVEPVQTFRNLDVSWDRYIGQDLTIRLSYNQALSEEKTSRFLASATKRFSRFDGTLDLGYDTTQNSVIVGFRLSTSLGWTDHGYQLARPGLATGGSAAVEVYQDLNANGRRDPGEPPAVGVRLQAGPGGTTVTGKDGIAWTGAMGDARRTSVVLDPGSIEDPYVKPERLGFDLLPRPGRRHRSEIGLVRSADVETSVVFQAEGERAVSNVQLELVDEHGKVGATARSDFDGFLLFQSVLPGVWRLRLEPGQAERLGLEIGEAPPIEIKPGVDVVKAAPIKVRRRGEAVATAPQELGLDQLPPAPKAAPASFVFQGARLRGAKAVDPSQLEKVWTPYIGKTVTLAELKTVAGALETAYADAGYPFVAVVVPPQDVQGGMVDFDVIEGRITDLTLLGLNSVARKQAASVFSPLIDLQPLSLDDVQAAYEHGRAVPGLALAGSLRRGGKPGGMDLVVQVRRRPFRFYLNVNNLYPDAVGPWGFLGGIDYNGESRFGDQTSLQLYSSSDFDEQRLVRVAHTRKINAWGTTVSAAFLAADANPGGIVQPLDLATAVTAGDIEVAQPLIVKGDFTLSGSLALNFTDQQTRVFKDVGLTEDHLRIAIGRLQGTWSPGDRVLRASVEIRRGLDFLDASNSASLDLSRFGADPEAWVLRVSASGETPLTKYARASLRLEGQYSPDSLTAPEEFSVGNLTIGRGYQPGSSYGDSAAGMSFELRSSAFTLRPKITAEPFVFFDGVQVWNFEFGAPNDRFIASTGLGVRFSWADRARLDLAYAIPLSHPLGIGEPIPDPRFLVNLTASLGEVSSSVREALTALTRTHRGGAR